jgi:hypothetical protein
MTSAQLREIAQPFWRLNAMSAGLARVMIFNARPLNSLRFRTYIKIIATAQTTATLTDELLFWENF